MCNRINYSKKIVKLVTNLFHDIITLDILAWNFILQILPICHLTYIFLS